MSNWYLELIQHVNGSSLLIVMNFVQFPALHKYGGSSPQSRTLWRVSGMHHMRGHADTNMTSKSCVVPR